MSARPRAPSRLRGGQVRGGRAARPALLATILLLVLPGAACRLRFTRVQVGQPLDVEGYEKLREGETTLQEALDEVGAPNRVEYVSGRNFLWYFHEDATRAGIEFEVPSPILNLGFRYTPVELDGSSEDTNTLALVFDESGILEQKSLQLSEAYEVLLEDEESGWAVHLAPRAGVSPVIWGDGGEASYFDLFRPGYTGGLEVGVSPAPFVMVIVGATYQSYAGDSVSTGGRRLSLSDLELYQAEIGGRVQAPAAFVARFWDFEAVKALFYSVDLHTRQGPFVYFKWTLSATYNEEVRADLDGSDAGVYFEDGLGLSTALGLGFEYRAGLLGVHVEALYQTIDPFDNRALPGFDTDAAEFQSLLVNAGISLAF